MIRFTNVSFAYPDGTEALHDVSLRIDDGEFVFLVGPSGAGKTSLTKLLFCEQRAQAGTLEVNGFQVNRMRKRKIPYLRRTLGIVFQDFRLFENKTVYENVAFAMRVINAPTALIRKRVPYFLNLVGLSDKADNFPKQLSGGEQQRVALARALANNPAAIIADEPTGSIDNELRDDIMNLLIRINKIGKKTVIVITHDTDLLRRYSFRTIELCDGRIISDQMGFDGYHQILDGGED